MGERTIERSFLIELGSALHKYGTPAHRLEASLENMGQAMGNEIQVFSTPTSLFFSFQTNEGPDDVQMLRVLPSPENLGKLCEIDEIADEVAQKNLSPEKGLTQLRKVIKKPDPYNSVWTTAAFALTSTCISIILGGSQVLVNAKAAVVQTLL